MWGFPFLSFKMVTWRVLFSLNVWKRIKLRILCERGYPVSCCPDGRQKLYKPTDKCCLTERMQYKMLRFISTSGQLPRIQLDTEEWIFTFNGKLDICSVRIILLWSWCKRLESKCLHSEEFCLNQKQLCVNVKQDEEVTQISTFPMWRHVIEAHLTGKAEL